LSDLVKALEKQKCGLAPDVCANNYICRTADLSWVKEQSIKLLANDGVLSGAPVTAMQSLQPMKTSTNSVKLQSHTMDVLAAVHN